jgi:manganese catalase
VNVPSYRFLQFDAAPEKPDPVYAHKLQKLIGGAYGEMTVTMQYLFQGWTCRMPGKYKDLIMDVATEKMGHVEMIATMVARLLEGAPATATAKAAAADPVVGALLGGMDPQQAIVAGGGPLLPDANGYPWNGRYIVASGNLLADFRANAAAEAQRRVQTARPYNMTDDPGVKNMLKFNLSRDTLHQNLWLTAGRSVGVGVEHCGASADYQTLYRQFGITAAAVAAATRDSIHDARNGTRPGGHPATFAPAAGGTADRPA